MNRFILSVSMMILPAACGGTMTEDPPAAEPAPEEEIIVDLFRKADSLAMSGDFPGTRENLLRIMSEHPDRTDEVLFRLLGLHHGQAVEDNLLLLLDSLEMADMPALTGWKVSVLDLSGRPEDALALASFEDPYLRAWLAFETDSVPRIPAVPVTAGPGEAWSLAGTAPQGGMGAEILAAMAPFESLFPSVRAAMMRELDGSRQVADTLPCSILEALSPGPDRDLALSKAEAAADTGSLQHWLDMLASDPRIAAVAVEELLERFPGSFRPGWEVVDALVSVDSTDLAAEYSANGDRWHAEGSRMAVLLREGELQELLRLTESVGSDAPDSLRARAALFRCRALRGSGVSSSSAYAACLDFARRWPEHPFARELAYDAGKYHDCEQEWAAGADAYLVSLTSSGSFVGDERAHWRGGFCLYMSGEPERADSLWREGCRRWPAGYWRDEMLFWRARLQGELGRAVVRDSLLSEAGRSHPWEFYGMLAAERLGSGDGPDMHAFEIRLMEDPVCSLAVELTAAGYGRAALELLSSASGCAPERAAALSLMGRHGAALEILRRLDTGMREQGRMLPDSLLWLYFPAPYRDLARLSTEGLLLDAAALQGIMREESYFDRWVVSRAGARGVVQLMPGTAADVARWYGLPPLSEEQFFEPAASVPYGALYIDRQYRGFRGDYPLFLAAYNAGPGNASRWMDMHGWDPEDPEMYIEQITYRETRIYVKKVLRSAWIYERR
ncbi:MAG: hypothetical protein AVO35_02850 [Candidatus Aegiribacteria sp. MLS_C]|nr:MAG: hypothetical protein AVO35_02850 [Candidatus Aegiribacteria sp. MLS_C]